MAKGYNINSVDTEAPASRSFARVYFLAFILGISIPVVLFSSIYGLSFIHGLVSDYWVYLIGSFFALFVIRGIIKKKKRSQDTNYIAGDYYEGPY